MYRFPIGKFLVPISLFLVACHVYSAPVRPDLFGGGDPGTAVNGEKGGKGTLSFSSEPGPGEGKCVELGYDFGETVSGGNIYAGVEFKLPHIDREVSKFRFSLRDDGSGHRVVVQLCDANNVWFGFRPDQERLEGRSWRTRQVDLTRRPLYFWNWKGAGAPRVTFPVRRLRIIVDPVNPDGPRRGSVLVSGFEAETNDVAVAEPAARSESPVYSAAVPAPEVLRPAAAARPKARFDFRNDIPQLMVDGAPFFLLGAQCDVWRSTRRDRKTVDFFDAYREMNATAVGIDILWSQLEPEKDRYDFSFLDWFLRQAEARDLKLVLQLFFSNVCGKTNEPGGYPQYVPGYILDHPEIYTRLTVSTDGQPQLCPNNPALLERETRMARKLAEYLKENDTRRTVVMLQLDNEVGMELMQQNQACHCGRCETLRRENRIPGRDIHFTAYSFGRFLRGVADEIARTYDLPLYLNSPGWNADVVEILLKMSPNLDLVGADAIRDPAKPLHTMASPYLKQRNIAFCAEQPTGQFAETRLNLDILPWHSLLMHNGIGGLIWEAGEPHTVVYDAAARKRFGEALYPLKHAMTPLASALGSNRLSGWFCTDRRTRSHFLRENGEVRQAQGEAFDLKAGDWDFRVEGSVGGMILGGEDTALVATARGIVSLPDRETVRKAELGRFDGMRWIPEKEFPPQARQGRLVWEIGPGQLLRICRKTADEPVPEAAPVFLEPDVFSNWELASGCPDKVVVKVTATGDLPPSRLRLLAAQAGAVEPESYPLPALKKGDVLEKTFLFTPRKGQEERTSFRLAARLESANGAVAESGAIVQAAPPLEIGSGRRIMVPAAAETALVPVDLVNRRDLDLEGRIVWRGGALREEKEVEFRLPRFSRLTVPAELAFGPDRLRPLIGSVSIGGAQYEVTPEIVVPVLDLEPCEWRFQPDPAGDGERKAWFAEGFDDSGWRRIAVPGYWLSQGIGLPAESGGKLRPLPGDGWYRVSFSIPESCRGTSLRLLIGAIDDHDAVWFNGREIGRTDGSNAASAWQAERYYEIPAAAIRYGKKNTLAVKVRNTLGDGGIWRSPVAIVAVGH